MGLVYATATIEPDKQELLEAWLPSRPWASGATSVEPAGGYRFDDPAGEVGVETIVWRTPDGTLLQVPFTYRATPLAGADQFLVGTSEHSVLGPRWVYDGCGDPVWAAAITTVILTGGQQAQVVIERDGQTIGLPCRLPVRGSGVRRRRGAGDRLGRLGQRRRRGHDGGGRVGDPLPRPGGRHADHG